MKIAAWVVAILLLVAGIAPFIEVLTMTNSGWLSIQLLALPGVFTCPAIVALLVLFGLYDLAMEVNGQWMEFRKRNIDRRAVGCTMLIDTRLVCDDGDGEPFAARSSKKSCTRSELV